MRWFVAEAFGEGGCILLYLLCGVEGGGAVVDAEAASGIDVSDVVAVLAKVGDQAGDTGQGRGEGIDFADLGADVSQTPAGSSHLDFAALR